LHNKKNSLSIHPLLTRIHKNRQFFWLTVRSPFEPSHSKLQWYNTKVVPDYSGGSASDFNRFIYYLFYRDLSLDTIQLLYFEFIIASTVK